MVGWAGWVRGLGCDGGVNFTKEIHLNKISLNLRDMRKQVRGGGAF